MQAHRHSDTWMDGQTDREENEREREIFRRRRPKLDGFGKTRRHSKAFAGGARGERHRDRGETRWDGVRDLSFVFFRARGPRRTPGARFDRFLLGLVSRRINLSTHTLFFLFSFGDYRKNGENQTSQRRSGGWDPIVQKPTRATLPANGGASHRWFRWNDQRVGDESKTRRGEYESDNTKEGGERYRNVGEARDERAVVERLREKRKLVRETRIVLLYFST